MGQNEKALQAKEERSIHKRFVPVVFVGVCVLRVGWSYYEMYFLPWVALK